MIKITNWNLGSVSAEVQKIVLDIPTTLTSGDTILGMADRQRLFMERYTGLSIGSVAIGEQYQQPLVDLTAASVLNSMEIEEAAGADISDIKIGDISISKSESSSSPTTKIKNMFQERGMAGLRLLGKKISFVKALG